MRYKILTSLITLLAYFAPVWGANYNPFVINEYSGDMTVVIREDIDSITFSHYDMDSVYHQDVVMQLVWTADTVYKNMLTEIDCVTLSADTNVRHGAKQISDEMMRYLKEWIPDTILVFNQDIPAKILPKPGDKLYLEESTAILPIGFIGEVKSVETDTDGIHVVCKKISYSDVYDNYFNVIEAVSTEEDDSSEYMGLERRAPSIDHVFNLPPMDVNLKSADIGVRLDNGLTIGRQDEISGHVYPSVRLKMAVLVDNGLVNVSGKIVTDIRMTETLSASVSVEREYSKPLGKIERFIPRGYGAKYYAEGGVFFRAGVQLQSEISFEQNWRHVYTFSADNQSKDVKTTKSHGFTDSTWKGVAIGEGTCAFGGYINMGFAFLSTDFAKLGLQFEAGGEMQLNSKITITAVPESEKTTELYEILSKDDNIAFRPYVSCDINGGLFKDRLSFSHAVGKHEYPILFRRSILPRFSNIEYDNSTRLMTGDISQGGVANPGYGAMIFEKDKDGTVDYNQYTFAQSSSQEEGFRVRINNLMPVGKGYRMHPAFQFLGHNILADPSVDVESIESTAGNLTFSNIRYYYPADGSSGYILADIHAENLSFEGMEYLEEGQDYEFGFYIVDPYSYSPNPEYIPYNSIYIPIDDITSKSHTFKDVKITYRNGADSYDAFKNESYMTDNVFHMRYSIRYGTYYSRKDSNIYESLSVGTARISDDVAISLTYSGVTYSISGEKITVRGTGHVKGIWSMADGIRVNFDRKAAKWPCEYWDDVFYGTGLPSIGKWDAACKSYTDGDFPVSFTFSMRCLSRNLSSHTSRCFSKLLPYTDETKLSSSETHATYKCTSYVFTTSMAQSPVYPDNNYAIADYLENNAGEHIVAKVVWKYTIYYYTDSDERPISILSVDLFNRKDTYPMNKAAYDGIWHYLGVKD